MGQEYAFERSRFNGSIAPQAVIQYHAVELAGSTLDLSSGASTMADRSWPGNWHWKSRPSIRSKP